jgi:hypothetical protein
MVIALIGTDQTSYELGFRIAAGALFITAIACWWTMRDAPRREPELAFVTPEA